jgi:hypothetical protein
MEIRSFIVKIMFRVLWIAAIFAVIGSTMTGCDNGAKPGGDPDHTVNVPGDTLYEKLIWLDHNVENDGNYVVEVNNDELVSLITLSYNKSNIVITLKGTGSPRTIRSSSFLLVGTGVTLVLDNNIILGSPVSVSGGTFVMNGGSISGNTVSSGGVVVEIDDNGTFVMNGGSISGNTSIGFNTAVVRLGENGTFTMNDGTISDNTGKNISVIGGQDSWNVVDLGKNGTFTMNGGTISGNTTLRDSAVVTLGKNGTFTMNDGAISGNKSRVVVSSSGTFTMYGGNISGNTYDAREGKAVSMGGDGAVFTMHGGKISDNDGTGVKNVDGGTFTMYDGEISGHTAEGVLGNVIMHGGTISGNQSGGVWGGITMYGGIISGNTGSGVGGSVTMYGGTITGNTSDKYGGGVYVPFNQTFTMNGGTISGNTAAYGGGGVYVTASTGMFNVPLPSSFTMNDGTISGNDGGGVHVGQECTFTMNGGEISGNTDYYYGGGVSGASYKIVFTKTGGTIYGYSPEMSASNVVKDSSGVVQSNQGHAVFVGGKRRENTAGPEVNFWWDGTSDPPAFGGDWDN